MSSVLQIHVRKCSKILNTSSSYLPKRPRKTEQTQIWLLLKKQPHQGLLCLYSDKHFVNSNPENQHFILEQKKEKVFVVFENSA